MKRYEYVSTGTGGGHMFHEDGSLGQFGEYVLADEAEKLEAENAELKDKMYRGGAALEMSKRIAELEAALRQAGKDIHDNLCASDVDYDMHCEAHRDVMAALKEST